MRNSALGNSAPDLTEASARVAERECFIFVVDGDLLQTQSIPLALSLRKAHGALSHVKSYAYVSSRSQALPDLVQFVYAQCGVETRALPDAADHWSKPYPHGNKILACAADREEVWTTFLDTDMLVCSNISGLRTQDSGEVFLVPEGLPTWGEGDKWQRAYAHIGQEVPPERVKLVRGREVLSPPYFNAGFISFSEKPVGRDSVRFGKSWLAVASDFDKKCPVRNKRPWLDQITLPLTFYHHGIQWKALPDIFNYSLAKRERVRRRERSVKVMHYHSFKYLEGRSLLLDHIEWLLDCAPVSLHSEITRQFLSEELSAQPMAES